MRNPKTLSSNTKVYPIGGNVYMAIIHFNDDSSLNILFKCSGIGFIEPCTLADKFIYNSFSEDIRKEIYSLYVNL